MRNEKGFSLIEYIMVVVIMGVIIAIGGPLVFEAVDAGLLQSKRKEMSESAKIAMDRMVREIRRIHGRTSVTTANGSSFRFTDIDGRDITFDISGTTLRRAENSSVNTLADNVNSFSLIYYDANGAVIATPSVNPSQTNIRRIEINLTFSFGGTQLSFQSQVSPRRLQ